MHCFGMRVYFVILFGIFAGYSFAQKAADSQDLTADELAVNASSFYAQGKYAEAAGLYRKFVTDFGSAVEARLWSVRRAFRSRLPLRLQRFSEALDAIREARQRSSH